MTDYGVTSKGFIVKPYSVILEELKNRAKEKFGSDIDLSPTSLLLKLLEDIAAEFYSLELQMEAVYNAGYLNTATGDNLDEVVAIFGLTRKSATPSEGVVTFSRSTPASSDIVIPKGTRVATNPVHDPYVIFKTTEEKILAAGTTSIDVKVQSTGYGSDQNVASNTITEFIDTITGIEAVTNAEATTGGTDKESDPSLRYRARYYAPAANATVHAIISKLEEIEGVTDVSINEDFSDCSVEVTIAGGDDTKITNTIDTVRAAGIKVSWVRPTMITITVTAEIKKKSEYDAADVQANVENAIEAYISGLHIDEDVIYSDLAKAILDAEGVDDINSLSASADGNIIDAFGEILTIGANEKAQNGTHSITIV